MQIIKYYVEYVNTTDVKKSTIILYKVHEKVATKYAKKLKFQRKDESIINFLDRDKTKVIIETLYSIDNFNPMLKEKLENNKVFEINETEFYKDMFNLLIS